MKKDKHKKTLEDRNAKSERLAGAGFKALANHPVLLGLKDKMRGDEKIERVKARGAELAAKLDTPALDLKAKFSARILKKAQKITP